MAAAFVGAGSVDDRQLLESGPTGGKTADSVFSVADLCGVSEFRCLVAESVNDIHAADEYRQICYNFLSRGKKNYRVTRSSPREQRSSALHLYLQICQSLISPKQNDLLKQVVFVLLLVYTLDTVLFLIYYDTIKNSNLKYA
jgi:hypothetical protein